MRWADSVLAGAETVVRVEDRRVGNAYALFDYLERPVNWLKKIFQRRTKPLDNVTPRVQELFKLARQNADRLGHGYVGPEHLLLGLLDLADGVGFSALKHLGVAPAGLRKEIENEVERGSSTNARRSIPYTSSFREVLTIGEREAESMSLKYFGTEHLLLGLIQVKGPAADALKSQKTELSATRRAVRDLLTPAPAPTTLEEGERKPLPEDMTKVD